MTNPLSDILEFLLPRHCELCGTRLSKDEKRICLSCVDGLPRTNAHLVKDNPIEKLFWTYFPIEKATSFFFYDSKDVRWSIYGLKYFENPELGEEITKIMAKELLETGWFEGMDTIVPLPLHWKRKMKRGYNQSYYIAKGISKVTGLPIDTKSLKRVVNNVSQTRMSHATRKDNVKDVFRLVHPELVAGKHILLIDDVITTGSTTISCAKELAKAGDVKISVLSIGFAGNKFFINPDKADGQEEQDLTQGIVEYRVKEEESDLTPQT